MRHLIFAMAIALIIVLFGGCARKSAPPVHVTPPEPAQLEKGTIKFKRYSVSFPNSPPLVWKGEIDDGEADADGNLKFSKINTVFYKNGNPALKLSALSGFSNIINEKDVVVHLKDGIHAIAVGKDLSFDADSLIWNSTTGKISAVNVRMIGMGFVHKALQMDADIDLNHIKFTKKVQTDFMGDK